MTRFNRSSKPSGNSWSHLCQRPIESASAREEPATGAGRDACHAVRYFPKNLGTRFSRNARMPS